MRERKRKLRKRKLRPESEAESECRREASGTVGFGDPIYARREPRVGKCGLLRLTSDRLATSLSPPTRRSKPVWHSFCGPAFLYLALKVRSHGLIPGDGVSLLKRVATSEMAPAMLAIFRRSKFPGTSTGGAGAVDVPVRVL